MLLTSFLCIKISTFALTNGFPVVIIITKQTEKLKSTFTRLILVLIQLENT